LAGAGAFGAFDRVLISFSRAAQPRIRPKSGRRHHGGGILDEGAGDIDSKSFPERLEAMAIEIGFTATRDYVSDRWRTLTENQMRRSTCSSLR